MDDAAKVQREMSEWRDAVGKAMMSFGEIEFITYRCLAELPSPRIKEKSHRFRFAARVDLIVAVLRDTAPLPESAAQFIEMLNQAKVLARTRNDIAHNPVMLNVFVHRATNNLRLEHSIETANAGRTIDLSEAKEFADEVENLTASMWLTMGQMAQFTEGVDA